MSYQVLARKWRPRQFTEMVGQGHVLRALMNALDTQRLHHAYLFTGTRGIGKTTVARILAKALDCERGIGATPCGVCSTCTEIDEGRFVDLIEVDAASRTKVDETRELLDNVPYAPARGRFKVYLIDEVHMFSNHSFNALLKTLEEPPPHVKFLLATTDPKKLPVTVLSRCLQFNLKRIGADLIESHLYRILEQEGFGGDARSLRLLAAAAEGSLRDALSLLDQAIAYGGGVLREAEVSAMLGMMDRHHVLRLLQRLSAKDAAGSLEQVAAMAELSADFQAVLGELLSLLHRIALYQLYPGAADERMDHEDGIVELAGAITPEECQLFYQIALTGRRDLVWVPDPRQGFEMVVLRMLAFYRATDTAFECRAPEAAAPATARPAASPARSQAPESAWRNLIEELGLAGLVRELACNCVLEGHSGSEFHLVLPPAVQHLKNAKSEARLEQILRTRYGSDLRLVITVGDPGGIATPAEAQALEGRERHEAARRVLEQDPHVQTMRAAFGARIDPASIRPVTDRGAG